MANIFGGGKSGTNRPLSTPSSVSHANQSQTFSSSPKVYSGPSCGGDSGVNRVLPTSSEALRGSQTQTFSSTPSVYSKTQSAIGDSNFQDFYTKSEIQKLLKTKADISSVYSEEEVDQLLVDLRASINLDLADFITEAQADEKISDSYDSVINYLNVNYYDRTVLYTKAQIDSLLAQITGVSSEDFILKQPETTLDNTISPGSNNAIPLTLVASSNTNVTTVQHWIDSQSNSIGRIRKSGKVEFYGYMNLGENIEQWRPALDVSERRISGLADPIHLLDAVNRRFLELYVTTAISESNQGGGGVYIIDCLEY